MVRARGTAGFSLLFLYIYQGSIGSSQGGSRCLSTFPVHLPGFHWFEPGGQQVFVYFSCTFTRVPLVRARETAGLVYFSCTFTRVPLVRARGAAGVCLLFLYIYQGSIGSSQGDSRFSLLFLYIYQGSIGSSQGDSRLSLLLPEFHFG